MGINETQRLSWLYKIARALHHQHLNLKTILQTVLAMTSQAVNVRHGCIITFHPDGSIHNAFILGDGKEKDVERQLWEMLIRKGLIGFVHHGQRTIVIRDITTDPRWPDLPDSPFIPRTGSAIGVPLETTDESRGVMLLIHPEVDFFDADTVAMLEEIAGMATAAIHNAASMDTTRASKVRYQWLFEDAVTPIILTDLEGKIVDANHKMCAFSGYKHQQLMRLSINTLHSGEADPLAAHVESLKLGGEVEFRSNILTKDGQAIPVLVQARRLFLGDREVVAWVIQDITAQIELEQLRSDLSGMIYHDLRGPLHNIGSSLSGMGRLLANYQNPMVLDLLQVAIRSTRQLARMVDSLLDIQRLEEGKAILNRKPTSLDHLLASATELVQPMALESQQRLAFELSSDLPVVKIDSDMILRVVTNLMENAVKYTQRDGAIKLTARIDADTVRISVKDSGPGIPENMQRQIFDKFSRIRHDNVPKGMGLGLAFCRLAVEAHGGRIWVESVEGDGSEFIFTLPLNTEAMPVAAKEPAVR